MATITLKYDARNNIVKKLINVLIDLGATVVEPSHAENLKKHIDNSRRSGVLKAKNVQDLINQCSQ